MTPNSRIGPASPWRSSPAACAIGIREPQLHEPAASPRRRGRAPSALKVHLKSGELLVLTGWKVAGGGDRLAGEGQAYTVTREKKGEPRRHEVALADVALLETNSPETVTSAGARPHRHDHRGPRRDHRVLRDQPEGLLRLLPDLLRRGRRRARARPAAGRGLLGVDRPRARGARPRRAGGGAPGRVGRRGRDAQRGARDARRAPRAPARAPRARRAAASLAGTDDRLHPAPALVPAARVPGARGRLPGGGAARPTGPTASRRRTRADLATREVVELALPRRPRPARHRDRRPADPPLDVPLLPDDGLHRPRRRASSSRRSSAGGPRRDAARSAWRASSAGSTSRWRRATVRGARSGASTRPGRSPATCASCRSRRTGAGPVARPAAPRARALAARLRRARATSASPSRRCASSPSPSSATGRRDDAARERLSRRRRATSSRSPGDAYRLTFRLPPSDGPLELFLESEGFYYEWMRAEWLAEEDPRMAALALADPGRGPAPARPGLQGAGGAARAGLLGQPVPKVRCAMRRLRISRVRRGPRRPRSPGDARPAAPRPTAAP